MNNDKSVIRKLIEFLITPLALGMFWISCLVGRVFNIDSSKAYAFTGFGIMISLGILYVVNSVVTMVKDSSEITLGRLFLTTVAAIFTATAVHLLQIMR